MGNKSRFPIEDYAALSADDGILSSSHRERTSGVKTESHMNFPTGTIGEEAEQQDQPQHSTSWNMEYSLNEK